MAKIKVHEIAKELGKQSKEIISFLQDKGIEAKAAQSSLEEEAAALVRKAFGKREEMKEEAPAEIRKIWRNKSRHLYRMTETKQHR